MANLFCSSIGKKVIMSLSGLFLITFLLVHLTANLFLLAGSDAYNEAVHFMGTNPIIRIMEPLLAAGFLVHVIYALVLTVKNMKARPVSYAVSGASSSSAWNSRNMLPLGIFVFLFLVLHVAQFYWKMKVSGQIGSATIGGVEMHDAYALVGSLFQSSILFDLVYIIAFVALGFHLTHGFWSAFQSVGLANAVWYKRLKCISLLYTALIVGGFTIIPLYFFLFKPIAGL